MAVDVRRVVEIWNPVGKCSGTGYLVADDIVLTALHNVLGCGVLEVRGLGGDSKWRAAKVLWPLTELPDLEREPQADGALVRITDAGWLPPAGADPVRWGRIDGGPVVADEGRLACVAVGFPRSEVRDGIRDTKEIRGHIERLTGLKSSGLITAYVDQVAVPGVWAGASGAALFARGRLIGVVTTDRRRDYDGDQLTAVSVAALSARPGFVAALGELVPEDVTTTAADREGMRRTAYDVEVPLGINNLPELPSSIFVGRAKVMAELERALSAESQTITQTVHGLGGVGKTTLALHYAHDHVGEYRLVWWLHSDRPELIEAGFAALTVRLRGEEASDLTPTQAAEWAVGWLQTHPGWLLVFDNAEKPGDVHAWTGQLRASGRHLITSRYKRGWVCEPISLRVLDQEASLALLSRLVGGCEEDEARALAEELGHLPLALRQAGAYAEQRHYTIGEYRALLMQRPQRMLDAAPGAGAPEQTMARIWRITLDTLEQLDPRAVEVLRIAAWYSSESIPQDLFQLVIADPVDRREVLGLLEDYSLIAASRTTISVHRLVQKVARTPSPDDPHRAPELVSAACHQATASLLPLLPKDPLGNADGWAEWRELLPQAEALVEKSDPPTDTVDTVVLLTAVAHFLSAQSQVHRAVKHYRRAWEAAVRLLGEDDLLSLTARYNMASAYVEYEGEGAAESAVSLCEQVVADMVRVLGEDDPGTLNARNAHANSLWKAGQRGMALLLLQKLSGDCHRALGPAHKTTLTVSDNLALAYDAGGQAWLALPIFERSLSVRSSLMGTDHPSTLTPRSNYARVLESDGCAECEEHAIAVYEDALADSARLWGEDHPMTCDIRESLTRARGRRGR